MSKFLIFGLICLVLISVIFINGCSPSAENLEECRLRGINEQDCARFCSVDDNDYCVYAFECAEDCLMLNMQYFKFNRIPRATHSCWCRLNNESKQIW